MASPEQSIAAFPAWALLNGIDLNGLKLDQVPGKGFGFVTVQQPTATEDERITSDTSQDVIRIPRDLILSSEAVDDYAKVDQNFRQLLQVAEQHVRCIPTRGKIVLYLFSHLVSGRNSSGRHRAGIASTAWSEYIKFLPRDVPVPTLWQGDDRKRTHNVCTKVALDAKMAALEAEFEQLREMTTSLPFWHTAWWEHGTATIDDWILADAWYRSRSLELPQAGEAMVPGLDMVNHSYEPTARYEELSDGSVALQVHTSSQKRSGNEVTISYGQTKSAAEMLFSYGFIDSSSAARELTLPLESLPDDPLGKAKLHAFGRPPSIKVSQVEGRLRWESPFMPLLCLNEEDGLDFRVLQDQDGDRHLRVFWQDEDVSESVDNFAELTQGHPLEQIFTLRIVALLEEILKSQLERIRTMAHGEDSTTAGPATSGPVNGHMAVANTLRGVEEEILGAAVASLEVEVKNHPPPAPSCVAIPRTDGRWPRRATSGAVNQRRTRLQLSAHTCLVESLALPFLNPVFGS
ncbi:SET domain-containing protein [Sarocladium implicatum]|nr:SET domain-containing protein [Sarocladium implicatum]